MRSAICIVSGKGVSGTVSFAQQSVRASVHVVIDLRGFQRNACEVHAIHIHEYGDNRNGCTSLGGHWNPSQTQHGHASFTASCHAGDLINNIQPDANGVVRVEYVDEHITLYGNHSVLGRSIVIHESPDDLGLEGAITSMSKNTPRVRLYKDMPENELRAFIRDRMLTDDHTIINGNRAVMARFLEKNSLTTGNAGKRMACGVIAACASPPS